MGLRKKKPVKRSDVKAESGVMVAGMVGKVAHRSAGHTSPKLLRSQGVSALEWKVHIRFGLDQFKGRVVLQWGTTL